MKLLISVNDTQVKKKKNKVISSKLSEFLVLEQVFLKFLRENQHFDTVDEVSFNLTLCGKVKIKRLNNQYRALDKVTDVLSFGVHDNLRPDKKNKTQNQSIIELGDIYICREVALKQASQFQITYEQEILHLATHGFLHLLGFDHEISLKEEKIMEDFEDKIVSKMYKKLGYKK